MENKEEFNTLDDVLGKPKDMYEYPKVEEAIGSAITKLTEENNIEMLSIIWGQEIMPLLSLVTKGQYLRRKGIDNNLESLVKNYLKLKVSVKGHGRTDIKDVVKSQFGTVQEQSGRIQKMLQLLE